MKTEYGIPVPRGVPKDWTARQYVGPAIGEHLCIDYNVPEEWGNPDNCVAWRDRFRRRRLIVAHYSNNRSATVRIDMNGNWKTSFGDVK